MTQFLRRPDGTISYDDSGDREPLIVAIPGMGDMRHVYRHFAPEAVGHGLRVVTMDMRGMGESSIDWPDYSDAAIATDILALVDELDSGPAVVVGNSLSAASAVIAAVDDPSSVSGLVLIGPFVRNVPQPGWQSLAFRLMLSPPWGRSAWVSYYKGQMYPGVRPPDHAEYVNQLKTNLAENGRYKAFHSLAFNSHADSEGRMPDVACPVLVVMGTADPDFPDPTGEAQYLADELKADLVLIEGAGHYPQAQAPAEVAEAVATFVGGLP